MAGQLDFEIVTPERAAFREPVQDVVLPGELGQMDVLPGHRALVTLIPGGLVVARTTSGVREFAVGAGFAEVADDKVSLLVQWCDGADEVDAEHARDALKTLESAREDDIFMSDDEIREHAAELARNRARLDILERATGKR